MSAASRWAVGSSSSCGTTWLTRPQSSAVAASRKLPVADSSRARRTPTAWGSRTVRPQSGMMPTRAWVSANARPLGRDEEVAAQSQLEPAGDGHAVDRPDDRLADERERTALLRRPVVVAEGLDRRSGARAQLLEVEPGAERGVGAGEDDDVDPVVAVEVADRAVERGAELAVERVARLRAVQGHGGDPVGDVEGQHVGVGHAPAEPSGPARQCRPTDPCRSIVTVPGDWPRRPDQGPSSTGGRNGRVRSPSFTSVEAIQPPMALRWSSRIVPSSSVASSSS